MTITFQCEHCRKEVKAPEAAAGKRGKCPYCGQSNYIPAPVSEDDILPLAPVDEAEERRRQERIRALLDQEKQLISESGGEPCVPLEHREAITPEDLHHFVVNYCLDMAGSRLQRAEAHVAKLKQFPGLAQQAVADFVSKKATEPALDSIPARVLQGFLTQLREKLG